MKMTRWETRLAGSRELKAKVTKLLAQGMSHSDVAKRLGISRQRTYQIVQELAA